MLTGRPPFTAGGPLGVVQQHLADPPVPLGRRRPAVPAAVEELVADLLAKSPDQRPPDAASVQARIAVVLRDSATAADVSVVGRPGPAAPEPASRELRTVHRFWRTAG